MNKLLRGISGQIFWGSLCLTLMLNTDGGSWKSLAQTQTAERWTLPQKQFPQQLLIKCGYRKKQLTFKPPDSTLIQEGNLRGENWEQGSFRCEEYRPPIPLMALIPQSNIGLTVSEYPTLLFYIPDANLEGVNLEFGIYDSEGKDLIYQQKLALKDGDAIIAIDLSKALSLPPLAVGKIYSWYFSIVFNPEDMSDSKFVGGEIQRVALNSDIQDRLNTVLPQEQPGIYAENGIWYEALASLAKLRCSHPHDVTLADNWRSLLQQVGLSEISQKPLAQCIVSGK
ncbi:MAG TPA: hypothetical protein DEG17_23365 [Cyanobacteria bacterium UBA11149]|nr:hypothetical protein [Cyanobacteria bacterium UBA11367]HBE56188.1 hypothetical protein [Cyanobacteria bacterium UBA11366]HBK62136.1 hypothetical protein [Cyanobacteria bacterium UBA11166]HBR75276.1 hypothetical protein [Cyanobacteria bacterium UBA11159]HBS68784.1 hypothetical protein [Cyanobacteria bacterium UBA11153]HBW91721.1 hypothetical protein [Cyanobacteria bacterium UBA11149]HCA96360.1 hypothetical protein [Cyanobacteria bacterium UBA9226]